jgi:RimJ/RimL family protein N-acetyltransferase
MTCSPAAAADVRSELDTPRRRHASARSTWATLRDGSPVLIRPVHDADTALLGDLFSRLSPRSRHLRFLGVKNELSAADVRQLTDVDHHNHEAMWALSPEDGRAIGIVRYVRFAEDSDQAEVALTVVDAWQRRGVGTELLAQLVSYARREGIRSFSAVVSEDNAAILGMLQDLHARVLRAEREPGAWRFEIGLSNAWFGLPPQRSVGPTVLT